MGIDNTDQGFPSPHPPSAAGAMVESFDQTCPIAAATVTGTVTDQNGAPITAGPSGAAACPGPTVSLGCPGPVTTADGSGQYTLTLAPGQWTVVGYAVVNGQLLTSQSVTVTLAPNETRTLNFTIFIPTPLPGGGTFVIGDQNSSVGSSVTFWSAQWAKANALTDGSAPSTFKGFATTSSNAPTCEEGWTSTPGNSSSPPATVPEYMAVAVTSATSTSGFTISGTTTKVVVVRTNPEYDGNPGHAGTGAVVAVICGG